MAPPCVQQTKQKNRVQTVVVKVAGTSNAVLDTHRKCWIWSGGGASALVEIKVGDQQGQYLVLTSNAVCGEIGLAERVQKGLLELPNAPQAEWIRPLTRRLQRLFHWGDVLSTKEDVTRACKAGDSAELMALLPQARELIKREEFMQLPMVHDALRGDMPPMLADSQSEEERQQEQRALHDVQGHTWSNEPKKRAECTHCNAYPAFVCSCGSQRCKECLEPPSDPFAPTCTWSQHPARPLCFFVIDQDKIADEEKVTWLRQELGGEAQLPDFCAKYLQLFSSRKVGEIQQKGACLKLYAMYRPDSPEAAWKKEGDLPPRDMAVFQRVWNPKAPERCIECRKTIEGRVSIKDSYCSNSCRDAGIIVKCKRCTPERKCSFCSMKAAPAGEGRLDQVLRDNALQLKRVRKMPGHEAREADPNHEAAWKKRRRS